MVEGKLILYGVVFLMCIGRVFVVFLEKGVEDFEFKVVNVCKGEGKIFEYKVL